MMIVLRASVAFLCGLILFGVAILAFAPSLLESEIERFVARDAPVQFYRELEGDLQEEYEGLVGIAHNAGNFRSTTQAAAARGADVIEIDVVGARRRLYATHDKPLPGLGSRAFTRPYLSDMWDRAKSPTVMLDLKEPSRSYAARLADFLLAHPEKPVIVSSRNHDTLQYLRVNVPEALLLYSVAGRNRLDTLRQSEEAVAGIHGVSVREQLLDEPTIGWFKDRDLLICAWVVNDLVRLNELVALGVECFVTDNLALLELLGGQATDGEPATLRDDAEASRPAAAAMERTPSPR